MGRRKGACTGRIIFVGAVTRANFVSHFRRLPVHQVWDEEECTPRDDGATKKESAVNLLRPGDFSGTAAEVKLFDDGEVGVDEIVVAHRDAIFTSSERR